MTKYQDEEASAHHEVPEDLYADASDLIGVAEDREVRFAGDRYEGNTQKTPDYVRTMDLDVANIDKNDKNTWRKSTRQLMCLTLKGLNHLLNNFIFTVKTIQMIHKTFQLISIIV